MKEDKQKINGVPFEEELEIFGEHKTREQVRAENKARKAAQRAALRAEVKRRREAAKSEGTRAPRKDLIAVCAVMAAIILLCVLALGNAFFRSEEEAKWSINPDRGHYLNEEAQPEMSGEGPKANVREAYFTQNGHLCVELIISNGTASLIDIAALDVAVFDYDTDEMIAGGKADIEEPLVIELAGTTLYTLYIAPEHILCAKDAPLPEMLSFTITIDHVPVEAE